MTLRSFFAAQLRSLWTAIRRYELRAQQSRLNVGGTWQKSARHVLFAFSSAAVAFKVDEPLAKRLHEGASEATVLSTQNLDAHEWQKIMSNNDANGEISVYRRWLNDLNIYEYK